MRLQSLSLTQFRNHSATQVDLSGSRVHLFVGANGSGKTNILEAISILSLGKSFLGADEEHLPQWGTDFFRIGAGLLTDRGEEKRLEIVSQLLPRKAKASYLNDVKIPFSSIIGILPTVSFLPQDLQLFTGPPSERRRFLDLVLSQVHPEYHRALGEYHKLLKQRNTLLRRIASQEASAEDLEPWDLQIAELGSVIQVGRLELVGAFSLSLGDEMRALGENWADITLLYERSTGARTARDIAAELRERLFHYRERDILLQSTTVGPHRDDWMLSVDDHPLAAVGSRGQQRAAVLALLFLEASYLEVRSGEKPVILLDDVFSELDERHQEGVMRSFGDHQVIMTSVEVPEGAEQAAIWTVSQGVIEGRTLSVDG